MNGDGKGTGGMGARMAIALCCLAGCNAGPGASTPPATSTAMPSTVRDAVRVATDCSGAQRDIVTLPGGERMLRVSLGNGFSHVVVGKMGEDGKASVSCVDNAPAAESFLAGNKQGEDQ